MAFVIEPDCEGFVPTQGAVEGHYLRCPHELEDALLLDVRCAGDHDFVGDPCITISPELTMVTRRR